MTRRPPETLRTVWEAMQVLPSLEGLEGRANPTGVRLGSWASSVTLAARSSELPAR